MPSEKVNISEFSQYMKSDKMVGIIYADIESLIRKIGRCAHNREKFQTKNLKSIFLADIQCQQFGNLIIEKRNILYIVGKIVWKSFVLFKRTPKKCNWFWKERNVTVNKRRIKITSRCNVKFNVKFYVSNEISVVFHNGSNHDYHFIIKELPNKFEGQFECLEDNIEKYKTLSLPIEKEVTKMDKYGNDSVVATYILENKIYW